MKIQFWHHGLLTKTQYNDGIKQLNFSKIQDENKAIKYKNMVSDRNPCLFGMAALELEQTNKI